MKRKYNINENETLTRAYHRIAGELGLYGVAVFGHHSTKQQRDKLRYIWNSLVKQHIRKLKGR